MKHDIKQTSYMALPGLKPGIVFNSNRTAQDIMNGVSAITGIDMKRLIGKTRKRECVEARHICIYLIKSSTNMTLLSIAGLFNRDHTSVIHAVNTITRLCEGSQDFKQRVLMIQNSLLS